jgi:hypothetical protein
VHLRAPSIAPGVQSFIWALVFAVYVWLFMEGVGLSTAIAAIIGALTGAAAFLVVRIYGNDPTRRERRRTSL